MPVSEATFKATGGRDPVSLIAATEAAARHNYRDLIVIGEQQRSRVLDKTQRGVDVDEVPFAAYAVSTVKRRAKKGLQVAHPDLSFTARMLRALRVVLHGRDEVGLGLYDETAEYGALHNTGAQHLPQRRWLGASDRDIAASEKTLIDRIAARLESLR